MSRKLGPQPNNIHLHKCCLMHGTQACTRIMTQHKIFWWKLYNSIDLNQSSCYICGGDQSVCQSSETVRVRVKCTAEVKVICMGHEVGGKFYLAMRGQCNVNFRTP